jgi:SAM-dependent methyltransferase
MSQRIPCDGLADVREGLRQWYASPLGRQFAEHERQHVEASLVDQFGFFAVQIGSLGPADDLLTASSAQMHVFLEPDVQRSMGPTGVYGRPDESPIASDSVDALVLPHTLEFEPNPYPILREAERVLIPEGRLVIVGFNPWSMFGLVQLLPRLGRRAPWCGHFLSPRRLRDRLKFLGFEIDVVRGFFFRPPLQHDGVQRRLAFIEGTPGRRGPWLAAGYVLVAVKRVAVLTPLRQRWARRRKVLAPGVVEPTARGGR